MRIYWSLIALFIFIATATFMIVAAHRQDHHGDFGTYRAAARALFETPTRSLYDAAPGYVYPPFLALALRPLDLLPEPWPGLLWDVGRWCCFGVALVLCYRRVVQAVTPRAALLIVAICFVGSLRPIWRDTVNGNVNAYLLAALVGGWWLLAAERAGRAGLVWSLLPAIKPGSAAVLLAPVIKRGRGIGRCWVAALAGVLLTNVLMLLIFLGPEATRVQLSAFPCGAADTPDHVYSRYGNHSLALSTARIAQRLAGDDIDVVSPVALQTARIGTGVAAGLWIVGLLWRVRRSGGPTAIDSAVSVLGIVSTLLSPVVWVTHYLLLVPAYATLARTAAVSKHAGVQTCALATVGFALVQIVCNAPLLNTMVWSPLALLVGLTVATLAEADRAPADPSHQ